MQCTLAMTPADPAMMTRKPKRIQRKYLVVSVSANYVDQMRMLYGMMPSETVDTAIGFFVTAFAKAPEEIRRKALSGDVDALYRFYEIYK